MRSIYKRILLKISGEALLGGASFGISPKVLKEISREIGDVVKDVQLAIVIGGGNIFRGRQAKTLGINQATADYMGMLATVINGLALQESLEKEGIDARLMSAIQIRTIAEPYIRRKAINHLKRGGVVIFAAGTGNPYFSTDTAAALRAAEIEAEVVLKATKVDGIYDKDPTQYKDAYKFKSLSYLELLQRKLEVIDTTAVSLCMNNKLPIIVFNVTIPGNLKRVIYGESIGTKVGGS